MSRFKISSTAELLSFFKENLTGDNLSIRGLARLCGVPHTSIIRGAVLGSAALAEKLLEQGFEGGALSENGFNSVASWLVIEYFAFDARIPTTEARQIARILGSLGIQIAFTSLSHDNALVKALVSKF